MSIDSEGIKTIAGMARLAITDEKAQSLEKDFGAILSYIDQITAVKVPSTERTVSAIKNVMREDTDAIESGLHTDEILANAPAVQDSYIKVKKVL
jgi:aspartyl-tRNA(Asn)/glutamyl-tRNA(Gln) amidotransferase subunit C